MPTDKTYNGWKNYETWNVHLWVSNEQGTDEWAREMVRHAKSDLAAGEMIRDWLDGDESPWPTPTTGPWADILSAALHDVDWQEIGAAFRDEEEAEDEDTAA